MLKLTKILDVESMGFSSNSEKKNLTKVAENARITFQTQSGPSTPSVIAQLFALEDEGRQGWVTKQPGAGTCWQELARSFPKWGLLGVGQRGPVRRWESPLG